MKPIILADGTILRLHQWNTHIRTVRAPCVVEKAPGVDESILFAVTVKPSDEYVPPEKRPADWSCPTLRGKIVLQMEVVDKDRPAAPGTMSPPLYEADVLTLADTWWRFSKLEEHAGIRASGAALNAACVKLREKIVSLSAEDLRSLLQHIEASHNTWRMALEELTSPWSLISASVGALHEELLAHKAGVNTWEKYIGGVVGTMLLPIQIGPSPNRLHVHLFGCEAFDLAVELFSIDSRDVV